MRVSYVLRLAALGLLACNPRIDASACGAGSIMATDLSGRLVCTARPTTGLTLPATCAACLTSDGTQLACVSRAAPSADDADQAVQVADLEVHVVELQTSVNQTRPPPNTSYIGLSVATTAGKIITSNGFFEGISAATLICSADFNTPAHMCTMEELYQTVASGVLSSTSTMARGWVYMPNANQPIANPVEPLGGIADTCGNYTDQTGSFHESGIIAEWGPLADGTPGFACCK